VPTPATTDIADHILKDSAHLQQADLERKNRHRRRQNLELLEL
jgi:hypothetical protein